MNGSDWTPTTDWVGLYDSFGRICRVSLTTVDGECVFWHLVNTNCRASDNICPVDDHNYIIVPWFDDSTEWPVCSALGCYSAGLALLPDEECSCYSHCRYTDGIVI